MTILAFFALPIVVCLARAFGPRWFNAWVALIVDVTLGALLYAAATYFAYETKMDMLRERGQNPPGAFDNVEPYYVFYSVLINIAGALVYYAPFALIYHAWEQSRQEKRSKPGATAKTN